MHGYVQEMVRGKAAEVSEVRLELGSQSPLDNGDGTEDYYLPGECCMSTAVVWESNIEAVRR